MGNNQNSIPTIDSFCKFTNDKMFNDIKKYIEYDRSSKDLDQKLQKYINFYSFDINTTDDKGNTLLHLFVNSEYIVNILLKNNISIDKKNNEGKTALFYSTSETFKLLIENGCDINIRDNSNHNVLYYNSKYYNYSKIEYLLDSNIIIDIDNDFEPDIQLHIAVLLRDMIKMKEIIDKNKFFVNSYTNENLYGDPILITPLGIACKNGFYEEFTFLIKNGADINDSKINYLSTLLNYPHNYSYIMFKELIELGIDVNKIVDGKTILHDRNLYGYDTYCNKLQYLDLLLKNGANIHIKTEKPKLNVDCKKVRSLVYLDDYGSEPLHIAASYCRNIKVFEKLFEYDSDPNLQNDYGLTPFMCLCCSEWFFNMGQEKIFEIIKLFIDEGADIYKQETFYGKECPLDYICYFKTYELKENIINYLYQKKKILKVSPKANEVIYHILNKNKN